MCAFTLIDESLANSFQTSSIQTKDIKTLSIITSIILSNHLFNDNWSVVFRKGSITIQDKSIKDLVIKIFIDYNNKLANKCNLKTHKQDPIVIGIELTELPLYLRNLARNDLKEKFLNYIDPRIKNNNKWSLLPITEHKYDIVFLEDGNCNLYYDKILANELSKTLTSTIDKLEDQSEEEILFDEKYFQSKFNE